MLLVTALLPALPVAAQAPAQAPAPSAQTPAQAPAPSALPAQAPPSRSTVLHVPPGLADHGHDLQIAAVVEDAWTEAALLLRYRPAESATAFRERVFERSSAGGYYVTVPGAEVLRPGIEYYITGTLPDGTEVEHFASAAAPYRVLVSPTLEQRWEERDRARLGDRLSTFSIDVRGHDFGNRFDHEDRFLRSELTWTHHLLGRLYAISIGYGLLEGQTPDGYMPESVSQRQGARYGFGGVRLRLYPAVWLDTQAVIGVSRSDFIVGAGGTVLFGQPWRAHVALGGEILEELGPTGWVRLQWDTVPPFLMSATVVRTNLPAAVLEHGSFVVYELSYPMSARITLRGSVSFGARDGAGRFGGGLGTSFAF
jgi:hypothetical protein